MKMLGALTQTMGALRILPHGMLHDQYQRGEYLVPPLLSFASLVITENGGMWIDIDNEMEQIYERSLGNIFFVAKQKPYLQDSPWLLTPEPVPWNDLPWLVRECELTVLHWARRQNAPFEEPVQRWLKKRDVEMIRQLGREKYAGQYRRFWNRDLVD